MGTESNRRERRGEVGRRLATGLLSGVVMTAGMGCDTLLDVEAPSRIEAEALERPENARLLVAGAVSDFECAFAEYIVGAGLVGNELADAQLASAMWPYDQRSFTAEAGGQYASATCDQGAIGIYTPLSTARWQADNALERLEAWSDAQVPDRTGLIAVAAAYAGYSHVLLGEGMCSVAFDLGPELTRQQVWERAVDLFTRAIQAGQAAGDAATVNMAYMGRARAHLNLGRGAEAAADARMVPQGFVRNATYSGAAGRRENDIGRRNALDGSVTVGATYRDLTFGGVPDPRVSVRSMGISRSDNITEWWAQDKFQAVTSPIPIARWEEAQLIIAEVEGGQSAVDIINLLHDRVGLPRFESSDPEEIRRQVIEERSRELFLESHHLGDLIRYGLDFLPAPGTPYPPKAGGFYGTLTCFPLPDLERLNNPSLRGS